MAELVRRDILPEHWSYGVCRDGRVFFIDDETRNTSWLHPRTGEPLNSGHMLRSDLPRGWEEGFTKEGASFFIDHNQRTTAFRHPVADQLFLENAGFRLQEQPQASFRHSGAVREASTTVTTSTVYTAVSKGSRSSGRVHSFGKRNSTIKRNPYVPVVQRGWLYKQDSSGMRLWRRKWFVLADYCLFYYKDCREENVLCSIPLPSYTISPVGPEDNISRKYAFKACHTGMGSYIYKHRSVIGSQVEHSSMRTYYFSADTQEGMINWVRAMKQAALMQNHTVKSLTEESSHPHNLETCEKPEQQTIPQINLITTSVLPPSVGSHSESTEPLKQVLVEKEEESLATLPKIEQVREKSPIVRTLGDELRSLEVGVDSQPPSHPPSQGASSLPLEQNGMVSCQKGPMLCSDTPTCTQGRKNILEQVTNWVKVQKGEHRRAMSGKGTLTCQTSPAQHNFGAAVAQQSLSKTSPCHSPLNSHRQLSSDYKDAQDCLAHFWAPRSQHPQPATQDSTIWRLYEWQQRQQYRHASPTAPMYVPAPDYSTAVSSTRVNPDMVHTVSVSSTSADIPLSSSPGPKVLSPRRPHTPAERVTVKPLEDRPIAEMSLSSSPHRIYSQKADDTYLQLKKKLEYLDLKMKRIEPLNVMVHSVLETWTAGGFAPLWNVAGNETLRVRPAEPVRVAESDLDVKLSRLCEQDKILKDLEIKLGMLKEDKDRLESVLDVSHQQIEQYQDQPAHVEKIAYQQQLLQEDLVYIRADISKVATEMERHWEEYDRLEQSVENLREALQAQMNLCTLTEEKTQLKRELWRIEDVIAGLSSTKDGFKITIDSIQNPERKLVPSVRELGSVTPAEIPIPQHSLSSSPLPLPFENPSTQQPQSVPKWSEEDSAPPRPPLPLHYIEDLPPAVPPLPKDTSIIRHTSVRGLKRQSDVRKRDRESSFVNGDDRLELRSYLSEPELPGSKDTLDQIRSGYLTLPNRGLLESLFRPKQSTTVSCSTLKRDPPIMERPKSALEQLYSREPSQPHQRKRMSMEEQLERMKKHQRALVRERKCNLSQAVRQSSGSQASSLTFSSNLGPLRQEQSFDLQLPESMVQRAERRGQEELTPTTEHWKMDQWLKVYARPLKPWELESDL